MNRKIICHAVISVLPILASVACMKTPQVNKDFGPEFSLDDLKTTLVSAQAEATMISVQSIKKGEFAYIEKSNQIENLYPVVIRQRGDTVTDRVEDQQKIIFTLTREVRELDSSTGDMKPSKSQSSACLAKVHGGCPESADLFSAAGTWLAQSFFAQNLEVKSVQTKDDPAPDFGSFSGKFNDLSWKALATQNDNSGIHWTYHNIKKVYGVAATPSLVGMRTDCGGRTNPCNTPMQVVKVGFDEVDWTTEKYPVKYSYSIVFSPEAPFFASQLLSCGSTTIPYQNQRIALLQCETVKDFTIGHDTP